MFSAQPQSKIKEIERQAAGFLVIMNYVLQIAKAQDIDKEMAEWVKFMADQLVFGRFMEKQLAEKINGDAVRQEAIAEVKHKRKDDYCYDIFVTVTQSPEQAKAVLEKLQVLHNQQSDTLIDDLEELAKDTQKGIDEKKLTHPAFIAAKRTNGWLIPRAQLL